MHINDLKRKVYDKYLNLLSMYRFLDNSSFSAAYNKAKEPERALANHYIELAEVDKLEEWSKNILINNQMFEYLDTRTLRIVCHRVGVMNYSRLNKEELISIIRERSLNNYLYKLKEGTNEKESPTELNRPTEDSDGISLQPQS